MGGRDNRWRVGGRDRVGVGTTKVAAIAVIPKSRLAWRGSQIKCGVAAGSSADNGQHLDTSWCNKNERILKVYMTFPDTRLQPADLRLSAMAVNWMIIKIFL